MNKEKDKHIGLRIDSETHTKLKDLAEYEGRSINGEIIYLIRQAIKKWRMKNKSDPDSHTRSGIAFLVFTYFSYVLYNTQPYLALPSQFQREQPSRYTLIT